MRDVTAKLKLFFSEFDLPAYARNDIPDKVTLPYIAYDIVEPRWDVPANASCQVYYPKKNLADLLEKADEILAAVGLGLKIILPGGYLMIYLGDIQGNQISDTYSESIYITFTINAYHLPGE